MPQVISYPHYCPNKFGLRALLLFYNDISTIVPREDQYSVRAREYIQELADVAGSDPISLFDPSYSLFAWERDGKTLRSFLKLAKNASQIVDPQMKREVRKALEGKHHWVDRAISDQLQESGWMFVASQKLRPKTLDRLKELGVALPMPMIVSRETGHVIEHEPILMPSELGHFAISRLARDIGNRDHRVPVTLENSPHYASLYRGGIELPDKRHFLISSLINPHSPSNPLISLS